MEQQQFLTETLLRARKALYIHLVKHPPSPKRQAVLAPYFR